MTTEEKEAPGAPSGLYPWYVLFLLVIVYSLNFIDRQIITILAPYIKADLDLTDAQIGLLYGTAFAMFYSLFGIPLARLADGWNRVHTLSIGLSFWSIMTTLSGLASSFVQLGLARLGVGIGEASASPAAVSLLSDYFPKRIRGTVLAIYTTGIYLGMGASLVIGGYILDLWRGWLGLAGWQAAFIIVGLPGVLLGLILFLTVREPVRGQLDGQPHPGDPHPFRNVLAEAAMMFPPWSIRSLRRLGAQRKDRKFNLFVLVAALFLSFCFTMLIESLLPLAKRAVIYEAGPIVITGHLVQWLAIAVGVYAAVSWFQSVRLRDPVAHALTLGGSAYATLAGCCALLGIYTYGTSAFVYMYGERYLDLEARDGLMLGVIAGTAGGLGTAISGIFGDMIKRRWPAGRIYLLMIVMLTFCATTMLQYFTISKSVFFGAYFSSLLLLSAWVPIMVATAQDLVIPRLRGAGFAVQTLASTLTGLGLGPYMIGAISDISGSLRLAILSIFIFMPLLLYFLWRLAKSLPDAERTVTERAVAAGELSH